MKKIIIISIIIFITIDSNSQCFIGYSESERIQTGTEQRKLQGDVKSTKYTTYEVSKKFGEIIYENVICSEKQFFDKTGFLTKDISYFKNGNISSIDVSKYENKRLIKTNHYNEDGKLVAETFFKQSKDTIRKQRVIGNGKLNNQWFIYIYNNKNQITEEIWLENKSANVSKYRIQYDKKERKISRSSENIITYYKYFKNEKLPYAQHTVDLNKGKNTSIIIFEYDKYGNLTKKINNDYFNMIWEYEYDNIGNWIKKTYYTINTKSPIHVEKREIKYYN